MPISAELIFARMLKIAAILAAVSTSFILVSAMVRMSCPVEAYSPGVLPAMYAALLMLIVYANFKFSSRGMVNLSVPKVRRLFLLLLVLELTGVGVLFVMSRGCVSIVRALPLPAGLLIFYTTVACSLAFGDAYLGVLRNILRLGKRPIDFMRDTDRMA